MFRSMIQNRVFVRGCSIPALVLLMAACSGEREGSGEWAGEVADSAGIRIVQNPGDGFWTEESRWLLEEDLLIGVASGDDELEFGTIAGIDVDDEGRIYVLDTQASRVRIFDPAGELIHAFGRRGQGPGELSQAPSGLFLGPEGELAIPDLMNARIARFSSDGEAIESPPLDLNGGMPLMWKAGADRTLHQQVRLMQMPGMAPIEQEGTDLILSRGPGGSVADTLAVLPSGQSFSMGSGGGVPEIRLLAPETVWTLTGDGRLVTGWNSEYSLHLRDDSGQVTTIIRRSFTRRPVTEEERSGFRSGLRKAWTDAGVPEQAAQSLEASIQFEDSWPAVAELIGGPDGTLWVQRVDPETALDAAELADLQNMQVGSPAWDVFDRDGRYLGVVDTPAGFAPRKFQGDAVYGVLQDELGVPRVARYRIVRGT